MAIPSPEPTRFGRRAAAAALLFVLITSATVAAQEEPDPVELARQAEADRAALAELQRISPETDTALRGSLTDVEERLETLANQNRFTTEEDARAITQRILDQPRFASARPTTVGSVVADWQRRVILWINRLLARILDAVPGGQGLFFTVIILGILAGVGWWASRLAQGRIRTAEAATLARIRRERGLSPAELHRRAREAAAAGDHSEAVRLLFLAGLTTLDERQRIEFEPGTTTDEIASRLESATFDDLAERFNDIVYGGRTAGANDYQRSQVDWSSLLESA